MLVTAGGVLSATVTEKAPVVVWLYGSVAVHWTVVVPSGNVAPGGGTQATVAPGLVLVVYVTAAPPGPVASTVKSAGRSRVGGGTPTRTVKEAVPVLACVSVARQSTIVSPRSNVDPDAGLQTTGRVPSMLSVAVAVNVTAGVGKMTPAGTVTTGRVV